MSKPQTIAGSCNCGTITLTIPKPKETIMCHCTNCRRSSGAVALPFVSVDPDEMTLGGSPKAYVAKGDSGNEVTRHFCGDCGSPIFTGSSGGRTVFVKGGLFNPGDVPPVSAHIFTKNMEEWEVVHENSAKFTASPPH